MPAPEPVVAPSALDGLSPGSALVHRLHGGRFCRVQRRTVPPVRAAEGMTPTNDNEERADLATSRTATRMGMRMSCLREGIDWQASSASTCSSSGMNPHIGKCSGANLRSRRTSALRILLRGKKGFDLPVAAPELRRAAVESLASLAHRFQIVSCLQFIGTNDVIVSQMIKSIISHCSPPCADLNAESKHRAHTTARVVPLPKPRSYLTSPQPMNT